MPPKLLFETDKINKAARDAAEKKTSLMLKYFFEGLPGQIFSDTFSPLGETDVPVIYLAGGMVPSIPLYTVGPRTVSESWQYRAIEGTGGKVNGDKTRLDVVPYTEYGNAIMLNPIGHGSSSSRIFTIDDYINLKISHGSIVFNEAGYNRQGNPGYATMAEIIAQFAKGGLNIIINQKGNAAESEPLIDDDTLFFEAFVTDKRCLVSSLDEAIELINSGEVSRLIADANEKHRKYLETIKIEPKVFIGGSLKDEWAATAHEYLNGYGIESILAKDVIDPDKDPVGYLRLMDSCTLSFIYQATAINSSNRLLPLAQSAYAVMRGKPTIYVSENLTIMDSLEHGNAELGSKKKRIIIDETFRDSKKSKESKSRYDSLRYLGPDFIQNAPLTHPYKSIHLLPALQDTVKLMEIYRR